MKTSRKSLKLKIQGPYSRRRRKIIFDRRMKFGIHVGCPKFLSYELSGYLRTFLFTSTILRNFGIHVSFPTTNLRSSKYLEIRFLLENFGRSAPHDPPFRKNTTRNERYRTCLCRR